MTFLLDASYSDNVRFGSIAVTLRLTVFYPFPVLNKDAESPGV